MVSTGFAPIIPKRIGAIEPYVYDLSRRLSSNHYVDVFGTGNGSEKTGDMNVKAFGYEESLDFHILPGYEKLLGDQQQRVFDAYERGYNHANHMGVTIAVGTGFETAKLALAEELKSIEHPSNDVPPSIFIGLENCT